MGNGQDATGLMSVFALFAAVLLTFLAVVLTAALADVLGAAVGAVVTVFLAATFLTTAFLATAFFVATFLVAVFLAATAFLAAVAVLVAVVFLAATSLAAFTAFVAFFATFLAAFLAVAMISLLLRCASDDSAQFQNAGTCRDKITGTQSELRHFWHSIYCAHTLYMLAGYSQKAYLIQKICVLAGENAVF